MACSLQSASNGGQASPNGGATQVAAGSPPTVQIISPSNGQQVTVGDDVEIQVSAQGPAGVDRLQLNVSGRTSSSKVFPETANPAEAILRWRPDRQGTFELTVIAYQGRAYSEAAVITLEVLRVGDALSNPAGGQPTTANPSGGSCTGRVLIGNLRIRSGPGTNFQNIGFFDLNEQVSIVGQNGDGTWVKARRLDGSENWVSNNPEWIELSGACTGLSIVS